MKANELRIGNLILHAGEIMPVYQIERRYKTMFRINDIDVDERIMSDTYQPVSISPEMLRACGFEDINFDGRCFMKGKYQLKKHQAGSGYDFIKFISEIGFCIQVIDGFHQLQNLYFALTGSELTVNLEKAKA